MKTLCVLISLAFSFSVYAAEHNICSGTYSEKIAIFIDPTDAELEEKKKHLEEEDFDTAADDHLWYQYQASEFFRKNDFPFCFTKIKLHKFTMPDGKMTMEVDSGCEGWCLVLWNGKDEPINTYPIELFMHFEYLGYPKVTGQ